MSNNLTPLCSHKKTRAIYSYEGGNTFKNIVTEQKGEVSDELANQIFFFEPNLTQMAKDYPALMEMIKRFDLKVR